MNEKSWPPAKEHQVARLEVAAIHTVAIVELVAASTSQLITKVAEYVACEPRAVKAARSCSTPAIGYTTKLVGKAQQAVHLQFGVGVIRDSVSDGAHTRVKLVGCRIFGFSGK